MSHLSRISCVIFLIITVYTTACGKLENPGSSTDIITITKVSSKNSKVSSVLMPHEKHEAAGIKCITCHHKENNDERIKKCASCHIEKEGYATMHKLCLNCHRDLEKGPKKCESCHKGMSSFVFDMIPLPKTGHRKPLIVFNHKVHSSNYGAKCINCHHTGSNENCANCHRKKDNGSIINLKGAFHQQCLDCHRKSSGPKGCGRCHKKDNASNKL